MRFPVTPVLRPHIMVARTLTGRLAAVRPNLLALPKHSTWGLKVRSGFVAPDGYVFGSADLNQIEMRICAVLSRDANLLGAYRNGLDIHAITAERLFGIPASQQDESLHRLPSKTVGFGNIMGISAIGLKTQGDKIPELRRFSLDEWERFQDEWYALYPGVRTYQQRMQQQAIETGVVSGLGGHRWFLPGVWSRVARLQVASLRQAQAIPIQGSAQWVIKRAMARYWIEVMPKAEANGYVVWPLLQIHDELLFLVERRRLAWWARHMLPVLTTTTKLDVPIEAKVTAGSILSDLTLRWDGVEWS